MIEVQVMPLPPPLNQYMALRLPLEGGGGTPCSGLYQRGTFSRLELYKFQFFIVLHHLHHVTTDTLQYIRTIIIPSKRTLHNDKKRKMCAVTKVA